MENDLAMLGSKTYRKRNGDLSQLRNTLIANEY
jgi:hypothetical protein